MLLLLIFEKKRTVAIDGEVYISISQLQLQSQHLGVPFFWELAYVLLHGLLHLCGYDDSTSVARQEMRRVEAEYMEVLQASVK